MTVVLRLDPAQPPLWTDPDTLRFGLDAVATVGGVQDWHLRLLRELRTGVPESSLPVWAEMVGASLGEARAFVHELGSAVLRTSADDVRAPLVVGVEAPTTLFGTLVLDVVAAALRGEGFAPRLRATAAHPGDARNEVEPDDAATVLIMPFVADSRRSLALLRSDRAHLPVVLTPTSATVGPLVLPGDGPCLVCLDLTRRDRDSSWPAVRAQLLGARAPSTPTTIVLEAAAETARALSGATGRSVTIRAHHREVLMHRAHDECGCRSLRGSATEDARCVRSRAPRTARALAEPA